MQVLGEEVVQTGLACADPYFYQSVSMHLGPEPLHIPKPLNAHTSNLKQEVHILDIYFLGWGCLLLREGMIRK